MTFYHTKPLKTNKQKHYDMFGFIYKYHANMTLMIININNLIFYMSLWGQTYELNFNEIY